MRVPFLALLFTVSLLGCGGGGDGGLDGVSKADFTGKFDDAVAARLCTQAGQPADCDICALQAWYGDGVCDTFCPSPDTDCAVVVDGGLDAAPDATVDAGPSVCERIADAHVACGLDVGQRAKDIASCEANSACTSGIAADGWDAVSRPCQISAECGSGFPYGKACVIDAVTTTLLDLPAASAAFLSWCQTTPTACDAQWAPTCEAMAAAFHPEVLTGVQDVCGAPTQPRACGDFRACVNAALKIQATSRLSAPSCAGIEVSMQQAVKNYAFYTTAK